MPPETVTGLTSLRRGLAIGKTRSQGFHCWLVQQWGIHSQAANTVGRAVALSTTGPRLLSDFPASELQRICATSRMGYAEGAICTSRRVLGIQAAGKQEQ